MTDEHPEGTEIGDRSRVVEGFLSALHDEDWHAASLAMDENIVYHNVGYPIIKGRRGVMRFWRASSTGQAAASRPRSTGSPSRACLCSPSAPM
jgi:limonene-1,2-epoxide hydrolase